MSEPLNTGPQFDAQPTPAEGEDRDAKLLEMFERWDKDIATKRGAWIEDAKVWYDLEAGEQWDENDIEALQERGRIPVVFNMTAPTIDAVCGAEIQNRQQAMYYPREQGDTGVSDALTQAVEFVSDECNGDMEDSEAFRDLLICGEGWTGTEPEADGKDVSLPKSRIDPLQMDPDPASRKACYEDARYLRRRIPMSTDAFEDFKREIGAPEAEANGEGLGPGKRVTVVDPKRRYKNGMLGTGNEDEVVVEEWQWWEKQPVFLTALPGENGVTDLKPLDAEQHDAAQKIATEQLGKPLPSTRSTRKVYYRALVGGGEVLLHEPLPEGCFRYKAMTGKRNRNKGTYFGLVKAMADPQRFLNKLYSEIMHIVRTNAKGGLAIEEGAVADVVQFEQSWAQADAITWLKDGALSTQSGQRIMPKTAPPIPVAMFQMMEFARDMVRACTGVNEEILGLVGREQAGVLEAQRKQAAYGILGPYFDAKRRYTRDWGRLILAMLRIYMPESKLVRVMDEGTARYLPLAMTMEAEEYDVVVDEAPNTPNQKAKVAATLLPIMEQMITSGILGPEDASVVLEYMDLPAALVTKLQQSIKQRQEAAAQSGQGEAQAAAAQAQADVEDTLAGAEKKRADAFKTATDAHLSHANAAAEIINPPPPPQPMEAE